MEPDAKGLVPIGTSLPLESGPQLPGQELSLLSMTPVEGSSPMRPGTGSPPTKLGVVPPPDYNTATATDKLAGKSAGGGYKARRRSGKIGLRPKIIIFSDKKDLIRVTLDSDETSEDDSITQLQYRHRHHGRRRSGGRSILGEALNLSSSR